jgi:hypothetical protein
MTAPDLAQYGIPSLLLDEDHNKLSILLFSGIIPSALTGPIGG